MLDALLFTSFQSQLVATNQSQVGSSTAEGVYIKVCRGGAVVERFKIVREGFICGDGRHWMHSHAGGERKRNVVVPQLNVDVKEEDDGQ